ncbi:prepilin peptidase [Rubrimonas cliftonensis]|uniref:prepilin peptidase n=1 Tax=Rubrimonas cliftonensis TaxID=89524 RepID=UPI001114E23E|nr:A24 family peptidase [Rubrimonas cliftonensis]
MAGLQDISALAAVLAAPFFGSFALLLAHRWPWDAGVAFGRSRCDGCGEGLDAAALAPVIGWAMLGGRARCCGAPLSPAYPLAEIAALGLALWAAALTSGPILLASAVLGWALLALALIDLRTMTLPDVLTLPLVAAGLGLSLAGLTGDPAAHALGAALGYGSVRAAATLWRTLRGVEGVGMGDAKLLAAAGAWVGVGGLSSVMLWACGVGLVWAAVAAARGGDWRGPTPFGPALATGFWMTWLHGPVAPF